MDPLFRDPNQSSHVFVHFVIHDDISTAVDRINRKNLTDYVFEFHPEETPIGKKTTVVLKLPRLVYNYWKQQGVIPEQKYREESGQ